MRSAISTLFILVFFSTCSIAQDTLQQVPKRTYITVPLNKTSAPEIDGLLNDDAYNLAQWSSDFTEFDPDNGTGPSQQTKFRIVYDDKHLYIGIRCLDSVPEKIEKRLSRRDGFSGDWVGVNIDSYFDKRTAFSFTVTAAGVKGDELVSENGENWDESWNPIWYTATNIDDEGWTAEMKIPFSQIKFGNAQEQIWGFQINRRVFRKEERSLWQHIPQDTPGWVSEFGILKGLFNIQPQKQLEIQPFVVNQYDTYEKQLGNPFRDGNDFSFNGGLDAKIGITNDLTLDLTVNPDFGQVDADPGAIALDGFQIFFEERRPFFIENKNIFDYRFAGRNDNVFYSRRIGRSPQGFVSLNSGEFVNTPNNTTILGAAKFSGKTKNGWSIGFLESVTGNMFAKIDDGAEGRKELVEPLTNYMVGRVQKDFNNRNSYIGGIFTATNRKLESNLDFLRKSAYSVGVDFRHNWKNRKYYLQGNLVTSHVTGSKEAIEITQNSLTHLFQRVDADHVTVDPNRTSLTGTGGRLETGKAGGGNWRYNLGLNWKSPELELNDIGFLRQADDIRQYAEVERLFLKPTDLYRRASIGFELTSAYDFQGNYNRIQYQLGGFMNFKNNWFIEAGAAHKPRIFTNTVLRGGPRWRWSEENFGFVFLGSDRRKKFSTTIGYVNSQMRQNNFSLLRYVLRLNYQPFDAFSMSANIEYSENPNKTQYVTETDFNGTPRYIMATIDQKTFETSLRLNYSINPNLSIQFYGQPFISRGLYNEFKFVNNAAAQDLNERVTLFNTDQISRPTGSVSYLVDENTDGNIDYQINDPDFAFVQFRSNLVVRWEYIPGSEKFWFGQKGQRDLEIRWIPLARV